MAAPTGRTSLSSTTNTNSYAYSSKKSFNFGLAYMVIYNVVMSIGWTGIGIQMINHYVDRKSHAGLFSSVAFLLKIFQSASVLEVVHCMVGLVRSSVVLTAAQVYSRIFIVWGIIVSVPQSEVQDSLGVAMLLVAWTVTEIIRYSFYWLTLLDVLPYIVKWCRYTLFLPLYPIGVAGELITIYASLPFIKASGIYSVELPNPANISFSYYFYVIFIIFSYLPVFPQLYFHMVKQRKKVLGIRTEKSD